VDLDLRGCVEAHGVEDHGMVCQFGAAPLTDSLVGRGEEGELVRVHGDADVVVPHTCPDPGELLRKDFRPVEGVHRVRGEGDEV